jgi:hypothetical protein
MPRGGKRPGAGRKAGQRSAEVIAISDRARRHGPEMIEELARLARSAQSEAVRVSAANAVLDRGYGRPPQHVEANMPPKRSIYEMSNAELLAIALPEPDFQRAMKGELSGAELHAKLEAVVRGERGN